MAGGVTAAKRPQDARNFRRSSSAPFSFICGRVLSAPVLIEVLLIKARHWMMSALNSNGNIQNCRSRRTGRPNDRACTSERTETS